jgi:putative transferase (TIGR04331 family)
MFSAPIGPQVHDYIEDQFRFAAALNVSVREDLLVRLYHRDYGWDLQQRWQDREPTIATDPGRQRLDRILREARLYVATYNATTFLESFTQGIPTVIFWDPEFWELSIEAKPYFDVLRQTGILFDDPVTCATMVNSIWDDVPAWWKSSEVQSAVRVFSERFAYVGEKPLSRLKNALTDW